MSAADMRRQRWVRVETRWRVVDPVFFWGAIGSLMWALANEMVVGDRQERIRELEAQVQRLQEPVHIVLPGQSQACGPSGLIPALGGYLISHATSQQVPVVYSCGGKSP